MAHRYYTKKGGRLLSTRPKTAALEKWLKDHKIAYDYINENPDQPDDSKGGKLIADIYLDDRGMTFRGRWDKWLIGDIAAFKPSGSPGVKDEMEKEYNVAKKSIIELAKCAKC